MRPSGTRMLAWGAALLVAAVFVVAVRTIGTPGEQREIRFDERRVADLASIAEGIDLYWTRSGELPSGLEQVGGNLGLEEVPRDPETSGPYEYRPLDASRYELCAEFNRESGDTVLQSEESFWAHNAGRQCFRMEAEEVDR